MPEALPQSKILTPGNVAKYTLKTTANAAVLSARLVNYELHLVRQTAGLASDIGVAAVKSAVRRVPYATE